MPGREIWTRPHFDQRTRRVLVIGTMVALGNGMNSACTCARRLTEGGFTPDDIKEILLQQAIYCGVPAANHAVREASAVLRGVGAAKVIGRLRSRCDHPRSSVAAEIDNCGSPLPPHTNHALIPESTMSRIVYVLNGPNLNLLGKRQPHIYGHETLADVDADCRRVAGELGLELRFHQSNREYEIIDWIHEAREVAGGIVINPAAFTHTSVAILDALNTFEGTIIEVHISNVHKREEFRHHSYVSLRADGVIAGLGTQGYTLALRRLASLLDKADGK